MINNLLVLLRPLTTEAGDTAGKFDVLGFLLPIAIIGGIFYFILYRPQKKQEKTVNAMRNSIKVGDEISTNGGIYGKVLSIKDDFLIIESGSDKTKLKIAKWAVRAVEVSAEDEEEE